MVTIWIPAATIVKFSALSHRVYKNILASNRLHDKAYDNLYELYKVICTLSVTQVQCERTFSKLKIIMTRLRDPLSEENMESYMFLSIKRIWYMNRMQNELLTDSHNRLVNSNDYPFMSPWRSG